MGLLFRLLSAVASAKSARTSLLNAKETAQKAHMTFRDIQASRLSHLGTKAALGDPRAQYEAGERYHDGLGVPQNYAEAFRWFVQAAAQGHAKAQSNVGMMYFVGRGVLRDYVQAYKWISLAAAQGEESAIQARAKALKRMAPEEIAEGERQAAEFVAARFGPSGPSSQSV
jgi:TPR repeat protein